MIWQIDDRNQLHRIQTRIHMEDEPQEIQTEVKTTNSDVTNRIKCLNCNTEFEGKFCPECGQSAETDRFTLRFIWDNLLAAVLGRDGGIGYTFKNLFSRPGKMIVEILNGKRRKYLSPFPTLFLALTLYVLIFTATGSKNIAVSSDITIEVSEDPIANDRVVQMVYKLISDGYHFYLNHYTLCYMLTLPLFIIAARKCYGKENRKRYYRAEYIVAIVYAMSILVFYRCVINLIYPISTTIYEKMTFYEPFAMILVLTACFRRMMGFSLAKTIWRSILTVTLYYIMLGLLIGIIAIAFVLYLYLKGFIS